MATHSSVIAWEIPGTEEPGGLQSTGSQRIGHDWVTEQQQGKINLQEQCGYSSSQSCFVRKTLGIMKPKGTPIPCQWLQTYLT